MLHSLKQNAKPLVLPTPTQCICLLKKITETENQLMGPQQRDHIFLKTLLFQPTQFTQVPRLKYRFNRHRNIVPADDKTVHEVV